MPKELAHGLAANIPALHVIAMEHVLLVLLHTFLLLMIMELALHAR